MRLREIFRYELGYRLKSGATWAYAGILFGVAIFFFLALSEETGHVNAPERIAGLTVIIGMFGMLVTAALFGDAAVRDVEVEMDGLLFTSPIGRIAKGPAGKKCSSARPLWSRSCATVVTIAACL